VIGGESPLRGLSEATASRRQLHEVKADQYCPSLSREGVWDGSRRQTAAPDGEELVFDEEVVSHRKMTIFIARSISGQ